MSHLIKLSEEDHCVCSPERICEPQSATCTCPCPLDFSSHIAPFPSHGCPAGFTHRSQGYHQPSDLGLAHYSAGCDAQVLVTGWSDLHTGARAPHMTSSHALSSARALVLAASARLRARRAAASQAAPARVRRFAARSCPVCHPP